MVFSERVKLAEEYDKWARENGVVREPIGVITFLDSRGLLIDAPPAANVTDILERVKEGICDNYCKYPERYKPEDMDNMLDEVCNDCPLNLI